jgi:hypothetical protein
MSVGLKPIRLCLLGIAQPHVAPLDPAGEPVI